MSEQRDLAGLVRYALQHNVQGHDSLYLSLAMRTGAELATIDRGLRAAALTAGVRVFEAT